MTADPNIHSPETDVAEILSHYDMVPAQVERTATGLINQTFIVTTASKQRFVLQRLHEVVDQQASLLIEPLANQLKSHGIVSPTLIKTSAGDASLQFYGKSWRLLSYIDGVTFNTLPSAAHASAAGDLVARFHGALLDTRCLADLRVSQAHECSRHLAYLKTTLADCCQHPNYSGVSRVADKIITLAAKLSPICAKPLRITHGDLKISNLRFDQHGEAICLLDLDTIALMPLPLELADAFRSWCNPAGEDTQETHFSLEIFAAAIDAYAAVAAEFIEASEIDCIVPAVETIYIELASRFCADALRESYFAWDSERFASQSEHNLVRALGQLNAGLDFAEKREQALNIVARAFRG